MKNLIRIVLTLSLLMPAFWSCYDDSALKNQVDSLETRLAAIEKLTAQINTNIASLQTAVTALQNNDYVTSISEIKEGDKVIGYSLAFAKSGSTTIYHGTDGNDGADGTDGANGITPVIGVKVFSDGLFYWTVNGSWMTDESGNKVRAIAKDGTNGTNGANGTDGITPQLKIENEYWMLSTDNGISWTNLGKATGADGKDGIDGINGGDSFFKNVTYDDKSVFLTLTNGTVITLPKEKPLSISFDEATDISITPGETKSLNYVITGATDKTIVKALGQNGWSAKVNTTDMSSGSITVTAPNPLVEDEVLILVYDGNSKTIMSSINFITGIITVAEQYFLIPKGASTADILVDTNIDYVIEIPDDAKSWVSVSKIATRSKMRFETITFNLKENTGPTRVASVSLKNNAGLILKTIAFEQVSGISYNLNLGVVPTNGGLANGTGNYQEGSVVNISATANSGYVFKNWTGDTQFITNTQIAASTFTMPAQNITLTANFIEEQSLPIKDGEVVKVQSSTSGDGIDLVFLGDGYTIDDIGKGKFMNDLNKGIEHFFSIEPYKSYKSYFDIYIVYAFSQESGISDINVTKNTAFSSKYVNAPPSTTMSTNNDKCFEYAQKAPLSADLSQTLITVITNSSRYAGTTYSYSDGKAIAVAPVSTQPYPNDFRGLVQHEAAGHGFGKLADEYVSFKTTTIPLSQQNDLRQWQQWGFDLNVDLTNNLSEILWKHFIGDPNYSYVGAYEGARYYAFGIWRSEPKSLMIDNIAYINAPSRELIVKRIKQLAGETYSFEGFKQKDVKESYAMTSSVDIPLDNEKLLPPPIRIIVN